MAALYIQVEPNSLDRFKSKVKSRDFVDAIADPDVFGAKITLVELTPLKWEVKSKIRSTLKREQLTNQLASICSDWEIDAEVQLIK